MLMKSTIVRVSAFTLFFFVCFTYFIPWKNHAPPQLESPIIQINYTEVSSTFNASVVDFWQYLATALLDAKPRCKPIKVLDAFLQRPEEHDASVRLNGTETRRPTAFTDRDEMALLRAHYKMRRSAQYSAYKLPFAEGTTGVVTTASLEYMPVLLVSLRMLRRTGCNLPMEVFIDDWTQYNRSTCDHLLPSLNARCIILSNILRNTTQIPKPEHHQYKSLSILFSSFQNVLYLDADAFPVYDPTILFTVPPYTTHGLITWPDLRAPDVSEHYYHISATSRNPTQQSSATGQIMLNKVLHRQSLLLMIYYNYYGPQYYYPLLSEPETYLHAALALSLPAYQVRTKPRALGRRWNATYRATGLAHADPGTDFDYLSPSPNHIHTTASWEKIDLLTTYPNTSTGNPLNHTRHYAPPPPKPLFVHQNILQMHPGHLLRDELEITFEPDGTPFRMWGTRDDCIRVFGYDVEERLWGVVVEEGCRADRASEMCTRLVEWSREVVGWMGSIDRPW